ncbi:acetoacetyl-CoA reductase [Thiotrichales bacterium 19S3-7]|nr:acetoacetyl-CoA reductase [Thiotrichales bacterium 19S3-7]MCF6802441.1 acetoacetyl-CoA reductase [Thiotrichales bacterium 19S3-11]
MNESMIGKIAVVTGGTRGIGKAICDELLKRGATVIAGYTNQANADKWLDEKKSQGFAVRVGTMKGNVADYNEMTEALNNIIAQYGHIDILVNNAGITRDTTFKKMSAQDWSDVLQTNLGSMFNVTRHVINHMIENNYGRIVNLSSVNAQKGQFGQTNYAATKAGIHGFTKALAQEVAAKGVTVNTVSPGYIATEMLQAMPDKVLNQIISQVPVGRLGKPEEIADLVAFLSEDKAAFITGADISINGGLHMH